jgi:hypothetical protein
MENQNLRIEMWNIKNHRHWTNNAVESCNSKLNSIIGKQQPFLSAGTEIKRRSRVGILATEVKGTW